MFCHGVHGNEAQLVPLSTGPPWQEQSIDCSQVNTDARHQQLFACEFSQPVDIQAQQMKAVRQ